MLSMLLPAAGNAQQRQEMLLEKDGNSPVKTTKVSVSLNGMIKNGRM